MLYMYLSYKYFLWFSLKWLFWSISPTFKSSTVLYFMEKVFSVLNITQIFSVFKWIQWRQKFNFSQIASIKLLFCRSFIECEWRNQRFYNYVWTKIRKYFKNYVSSYTHYFNLIKIFLYLSKNTMTWPTSLILLTFPYWPSVMILPSASKFIFPRKPLC